MNVAAKATAPLRVGSTPGLNRYLFKGRRSVMQDSQEIFLGNRTRADM